MRGLTVRAFLLVWILGVTFVGVCSAQGTASISGVATDASGSAIPGAKVTVRNTETGETRTSVAEDNGAYRILSLPVGMYEARIEKDGFKTQVRSGINLVVGQEAVINASLEVGALSQEVSVTAEAPVVNTTTLPTSGLVSEQEVKDLPLNGRSYDNLITLNAGTSNYTSMRTTANTGNLFSVSGRRLEQNLFILNGVEWGGNGSQTNTPTSVSGQMLGIDAIREFNVLTDNYSSEYGKRSGGQVVVITMGGTNLLHGNVFEFMRNSALDARNFFDQQPASLGSRIPHFTRNNFGGSLGGPIRKDKTFLFGNYEGLRQLLGLSYVAVVPDLATRAAAIPAMVPYLALWPLPNGPAVGGAGSGVAQFLSSPRSTIREDFGTARVDQMFSGKDTLTGVYTIDDGVSLTPQLIPTFVASFYARSQVISLSETHIFSPNVVNTLTAGFSRSSIVSVTDSTIPIPANLSFVQGFNVVALSVGAGAGGASTTALAGVGNTSPTNDSRNLFTYTDNLQITRGRHLLSVGVWFQRIQDNYNQSRSIGKANFSTVTDLQNGIMQTFQTVPYGTPLGFRSLEGAWFIQDTIKIRPNLTLSAGLRHEFTSNWNETDGRISEFLFDANGVIQNNPRIASNLFTTNYGLFLFNPRLGVAWDVFGNGKTAVHAGAGMYHNMLDALAFWAAHTPPFNTTYQVSGTFPFTQITPTSLPPGALVGPFQAPPDPKTPTTIAYNLKIEQQLGGNLGFSVGYVGSHGYHNLAQEDVNPNNHVFCGVPNTSIAWSGTCPLDPTGATFPVGTIFYPSATQLPGFGGKRLNTGFSTTKSTMTLATSNYNALLIDVIERLQHNLTFKANYTWSRSLDDASSYNAFANATSSVTNMYNILEDWGPSAWNTTHRFSFSGSYQLPVGKGQALWSNAGGAADRLVGHWQVNTIITAQTGFPINPLLGFNRSNNGNVNNPDRPSVNPNFKGDIYHGVSPGCNGLLAGTPIGDAGHWFDPCAFVLPTAGTNGNASRNGLLGPGVTTVDMSLFKDIPISERFKIQFRAEGFNVLNHTNFGSPNQLVLNSNGTTRATAGQITNTTTNSRQFQFGLKLAW